jgi:Queuosine salvage protein
VEDFGGVVASGATGTCERVRAGCAWVAARAAHVAIDDRAVRSYAAALRSSVPPLEEEHAPDPAEGLAAEDRELRAAFVICLDAVNFGSGWWPTIRKRRGRSGYQTIAAALRERFQADGGWAARALAEITAADIAGALGQDPEHALMSLYAESLRDLAAHVAAQHSGSFAALADSACGSAPSFADLLAGWPCFADESPYDGRTVPFFKRAQIAAADVHAAGIASLRDRDRLTAFADNLVPHVLRVDGVLRLDPALAATIDAGRLIEHGSPEEVELRACAVHAIELLAAELDWWPMRIDSVLWHRGQGARYKSRRRPRSRTSAY